MVTIATHTQLPLAHVVHELHGQRPQLAVGGRAKETVKCQLRGGERKEEKEGMRGGREGGREEERKEGGRGHILAFTQAGKELAANVDFRRYGKIFILTLRLAGDMASCGEGDWEGGEKGGEGRRERGGREGGCRGRERVREVGVREDSAGRPWGVVSCQGSPQCRGRE